MFWPKKDKEKERFYLLPGQGGRSLRRKHRLFLLWSILAGLVVSGLLALSMFLVNRR